MSIRFRNRNKKVTVKKIKDKREIAKALALVAHGLLRTKRKMKRQSNDNIIIAEILSCGIMLNDILEKLIYEE